MTEQEYQEFSSDLMEAAKQAKDDGKLTRFQFRGLKLRSRFPIAMAPLRAKLQLENGGTDGTIEFAEVDWDKLYEFIEKLLTLIFSLIGDLE